jgi:hypothetical protein
MYRKFQSEYLKGRYMVDTGANGREILKVILKEMRYEVCTGFKWLIKGPIGRIL